MFFRPGLYENKKFIFYEDVADVAPAHPFKLDREPDKYSLTYGSLYKGNIANYRPLCKNCVGNQQLSMVDKTKLNKLASRYFDKESRKLSKQLPHLVISSEANTTKNSDNNAEHFIPVSNVDGTEEARMCGSLDIREKVLDSSTRLYVKGVGDPKHTLQEGDGDIGLDRTLQKIGDFNKQLREHPENVTLWLEFVKYQDSLSSDNKTSFDPEVSKKEKRLSKRGMLEKKISILDKALEHNPGNIDLLLAKIELNSEILDSAKVNKELEQLLFVHPANTKLWKYYLMFNQSRLAVFTVSKMTKLYHKAFKTLLGIHTGKLQTHSVPVYLEKEILGNTNTDLILPFKTTIKTIISFAQFLWTDIRQHSTLTGLCYIHH